MIEVIKDIHSSHFLVEYKYMRVNSINGVVKVAPI